MPTMQDWAYSKWPIMRGTVLGFFLGVLPGGGAVISTFATYAMERRLSKRPEMFGKGAIEGVAGPEAANNSAAGGAFIPLLTLGIPPNVVMALLLGAFIIHGIQPGPLLITQNPGIFWGIVASMYIGNIMLLILNMPLIGIWVQVLKVPYKLLFPLILMFCIVGVFSSGSAVFDVFVMLGFAVVGFAMDKTGFSLGAFVIGFILGPITERSLRAGLTLSDGSYLDIFMHPVSAICVVLAAGGYPDATETGKPISGVEAASGVPNALVFHAGTTRRDGQLLTSGGRVLTVVGRGPSYRAAIDVAYQAAAAIQFDGMQLRRDIGRKAL